MNPIVEFKNVSKTFYTKNGPFQALNQINLAIQEGDIFGIIGLSGAGKSTLVRCINYLEVPTEGEVRIAGRDLGKMNQKELRRQRQEIGMIFQNFNLLMQRNVLDNICFPLEIAGVKKADARKRAEELLEIVGLSDKAKSYPSQLSGGQKQRVAIARALATNPKILLCDEATSALDPTTTKAILALLKEINQKFKITIVIITHEMAVVEEICNQVAIVDAGKLVETGSATDVFSKPQTEIAKQLVYKEEANQLEVGGKRYVRVVFDGNSSFEPAIADMILNCRVRVNIMGADMKNIDGKAYGQMILQMPDEDVKAQQAIHYLEERNIIVEEVTAHGNTGTHDTGINGTCICDWISDGNCSDRDKKGWLKTNAGGESDFGYFCKYFKIYSIFDLVDRSDPSDKTDCRKKLWLYRYDCPARYCSGTIYCAYDRVFFVGSRTRCCGGCVKYGSFPA